MTFPTAIWFCCRNFGYKDVTRMTKRHKDVYVNSFFPGTVRHWNSLPKECVFLTYNLRGCNSRINRHPFTLGSF